MRAAVRIPWKMQCARSAMTGFLSGKYIWQALVARLSLVPSLKRPYNHATTSLASRMGSNQKQRSARKRKTLSGPRKAQIANLAQSRGHGNPR